MCSCMWCPRGGAGIQRSLPRTLRTELEILIRIPHSEFAHPFTRAVAGVICTGAGEEVWQYRMAGGSLHVAPGSNGVAAIRYYLDCYRSPEVHSLPHTYTLCLPTVSISKLSQQTTF